MLISYQAIDYKSDEMIDVGLSNQSIINHIKLYQGYCNKFNMISEKIVNLTKAQLSEANQIYSELRSLKTELSFAWGGVVNHELYFDQMQRASNLYMSQELKSQVEKDFGSMENYYADLKATAMAARGWAWTLWLVSEGRLINHLGDAQNTYGMWRAQPLVAVDVYEHAYLNDFGIDRSTYLDKFITGMNWQTVSQKFSSYKI